MTECWRLRGEREERCDRLWEGKISIPGKWPQDFYSKNRLEVDYGELTVVVTF
jgi:hypothetical protein